ncbi:MAG TPA: hypothetical protein VK622_02430 [Puia sp.]|nr:hypothetical protein [Puia sp.]
MKRLAAILILVILLFNWVGYQLFTSIAENRENENLIAKLDKDDFSSSDLISIKIPAPHLSGYENERSFERVNGQVEIQGIVYNYVKWRFSNGSIELLCIPNHQVNLLRSAKEDFFRLVSDIQTGQTKKDNQHGSSYKNLNGVYFSTSDCSVSGFNGSTSVAIIDSYTFTIPDSYSNLVDQPPKMNG